MVTATLKYPDSNRMFRWFPFTNRDGNLFQFDSESDAKKQIYNVGFHRCANKQEGFDFKTELVSS